jgi:Cobalamin biosynthesis protein CobN and related Mg-chelatases
LIQPPRGYDAFNDRDIHSPDLPLPHRYLAQYF